MPVDNEADLELLASQLDPVELCVKLKVHGLQKNHLESIRPFFGIEFHAGTDKNSWQIQSLNREFGSHKIQAVRLLAVALLIHSHFPKAEMALMGSAEIKPGSPLVVSEANQIFIKQAGLHLKFENDARTLNTSEIQDLKNQLDQLQIHQLQKKGA